MGIRRLVPKPEVKLPPAVLYLDDLEEIVGVLRPDGHDQAPVLEFIADDQQCDTADDLRKIGGRPRIFQMRVKWNRPGSADYLYFSPSGRARLEVDGPVKHQAWALEQVRDVFNRRQSWVGKYRRWVLAAIIFVYLLGLTFWIRASDHWGLRDSERYIVEACIALPSGYFFVVIALRFQRSVVVLQNYAEHPGGWFKRNREKIEVAAVTTFITAIITTLVAIAIHRLSK
jgi:hypothetical protein